MREMIFAPLLLLSMAAGANEHTDIVERAFAAIDGQAHRSFAFTETTVEDEVRLVGRYDPGMPAEQRWTLLSVDGREPTDREREDYREDRHDGFDDDEDSDREIDMIDFDTLRLVEETDDDWLFEFVPIIDDEEDDDGRKFMKNVRGTVRIVRDGHYPAWMEMRNHKTIRPAFGAKISHFLTRLTFGPATEGGPIVLRTMDVQVKGRAALVISFDVSESTQYSEFERVAD
jgi:hypothetical protein